MRCLSFRVPRTISDYPLASFESCAAGRPPFLASLTACTLPVSRSTVMSCVVAVTASENETSCPLDRSASAVASDTFRHSSVPKMRCASANTVFGVS